ncbi:MAG TPA: hypothetical protein VE130_11905 [Nitrososphaeraceae archaeon]|nr:hypothetical protein [Nitrososphaeraceae archaeon]
MTRDFIEIAKSEKLIALIMEGTRITDEDTREEESEELISKESMKIASSTNRLVMADLLANLVKEIVCRTTV